MSANDPAQFDGTTPRFMVHALEQRAGWTPASRFATAVSSLISGYFPYHRYSCAGQARARSGATGEQVARSLREWMEGDLNPVYRFLMSMPDVRSALRGLNAFNARFKWEEQEGDPSESLTAASSSIHLQRAGVPGWLLTSGEAGTSRWDARRVAQPGFIDPEACRVAGLTTINAVADVIEQRVAGGRLGPPRNLGEVARHFGVERSAPAETVTVFEHLGVLPLDALARELGCHRRTLQRQLRASGVSYESLSQAHRLAAATARLHGSDTLTTIAIEEGYSDLAHMTRAFNASSGMSPSALRRAGKFGLG